MFQVQKNGEKGHFSDPAADRGPDKGILHLWLEIF